MEILGLIFVFFALISFLLFFFGFHSSFFELCEHGVGSLLRLIIEAKPKPGGSRISGGRVLLALMPAILITVFALICMAGIFFNWLTNDGVDREENSKQLAEENVNRLARNVNDDGGFIRHPELLLAVEDGWGNRLHVEYEETLSKETVTVKSNGADGMPETRDDLTMTRTILKTKKEIAKEVTESTFGKAKDVILDRFRKEEEKEK